MVIKYDNIMSWKITFYSERVERQTLNFPTGILANPMLVLLVQAYMRLELGEEKV